MCCVWRATRIFFCRSLHTVPRYIGARHSSGDLSRPAPAGRSPLCRAHTARHRKSRMHTHRGARTNIGLCTRTGTATALHYTNRENTRIPNTAFLATRWRASALSTTCGVPCVPTVPRRPWTSTHSRPGRASAARIDASYVHGSGSCRLRCGPLDSSHLTQTPASSTAPWPIDQSLPRGRSSPRRRP